MSEVPYEYDDKKNAPAYNTQVTPADLPTAEYGGDYVPEEQAGLKRQLKSRHLAMISIGGVIGTGLFLGTGGALRNGGPLGLFLGYLIMGSIWSVARQGPRSKLTGSATLL